MQATNQFKLLKAFRNGHLFFEEQSTGALLVADQSIRDHCFRQDMLDPTKTDDGRLEVDLTGIEDTAIRGFDTVRAVPVVTPSGNRCSIMVPQPELDFLKAYALENRRSGDPAVPPQRDFVADLRAMKEAGLMFGDCIAAFGDDQQDPYVLAAREFHHKEGEVEIDDITVVSRGEDPGAYVLAWVWVDRDEAEQFEAVGTAKPQTDSQMFLNFYVCPVCKHEWSDKWSAMCDDDCPACGKRHISPVRSEDIEEVGS